MYSKFNANMYDFKRKMNRVEEEVEVQMVENVPSFD